MQPSPLEDALKELHRRFKGLDSGEVATYIPELGRADPDRFSICVATVDGHVYCVGDSGVRFTIQSISKPFVYGLALGDLGVDAVGAKIGVEPSGEAFNAISLEPGTGRPRNPMINAGAIATTSLIQGDDAETRLRRLVDRLGLYAGTELEIDDAVFRSERETGHRNRAIGHLLRNAGILEGDVDAAVDLYFKQCSILVSCRDLAVMAATLANGGVNPLTGQRALAAGNVERLLSVMSTCGMYDYAGSWVYRVGMPAKSGVAGGVAAVLPGQLGIGVYSPRLDQFGNSVRGVAVCEALSREFGLHFLRPPVSPASVVRTAYSLGQVSSKWRRAPAASQHLAESGGTARVLELQGPLVLSTVDIALREVLGDFGPGQMLVLDCRRVVAVDDAALRLLAKFATEAFTRGAALHFVGLEGGSPAMLEHTRRLADAGVIAIHGSLDDALKCCEDEMLRRAGFVHDPKDELPLAHHSLLTGLDEGEIALMQSMAKRVEFPAGVRIIRQGDASDAIYLLVRGQVSVSVDLSGGERHYRLAMLDAGVSFGELALLDEAPRSANVQAESDVVCYCIDAGAIAGITGEHPHVRQVLTENIARDLVVRLGRANTEIMALAS
ncbi:MAG: glutaminase A [Chloroflexi bacterium]|nr:glutaminase A [Chloroflexota bacterium]